MSAGLYAERRAKGLCPECGAPPEGSVYCHDCRDYHRKRMAAKRSERRSDYNAYMRQRRRAKLLQHWLNLADPWEQDGVRLLFDELHPVQAPPEAER